MKSTWAAMWRGLTRDPERTVALLRHVLRQFNRDQCLVSAGMLTYATLLSLVPLTTVIVSTVAVLPGAADWNDQIQDFLFRNFVPAARETIQGKINELIVNARGLTATMGAFLIVTSLILMHNIELTINRIFGVKNERSWINRFMVYWAALTLGPILLGASLALSSYFFSLRIISDVRSVSLMAGLVQAVTPYLVAALAFLLIYTVVPNRKVPWRHALVGALLAALMFELTKKGFGFYVSTTESYTRIYGALAAIPIFLIWIYLSWSIILLGGSLTASLGSFRHERISDEGWPRGEEFILLYRLLGHLWQAHQKGRSVDEVELMEMEPGASDKQVQQLLENMRAADITRRDEDGDWVLVRDLSQLSLVDIYRTGAYVWPRSTASTITGLDDEWSGRLAEALEVSDDALTKIDSRSMVSFYAGSFRGGRDENGEASVPGRAPTGEERGSGS